MECKSSSRHSQERPSHLMLSHQTPLIMSRQRSKIRKESPPINKDLSSLVNSLKTAEPFQITTSRRNPHYTWSSDWEVECRSSSRLLQERPSHLMLNPQTQLTMSKPRSKTKRESHLTSKDSSLQESNWRMEEHYQTTTSKRSLLSI